MFQKSKNLIFTYSAQRFLKLSLGRQKLLRLLQLDDVQIVTITGRSYFSVLVSFF